MLWFGEMVHIPVFAVPQTCAVYAKQLVRLRQQKAKSMSMSSKITSTGHQMQVCLLRDSSFHLGTASADSGIFILFV